MSNSLGHPYLAQLFFTMAMLVTIRQAKNEINPWYAIILPLLACFAIWSSEISIAFLLAVTLVEYKTLKRLSLKFWPWFLAGTFMGIGFLKFAKSRATHLDSFEKWFASPNQVLTSMSKQLGDLVELLSFQNNKTSNVVLSWLVILISIWLLIAYLRDGKRPKRLILILFLASIGSWMIVHLSYWNYLMGQPMRYYTTAYFFGILAVFLSLKDQVNFPKLNLMLALTLGLGISWSAYSFNRQYDTGSVDRLERVEAEYLIHEALHEKDLDSIAIIGSYWNTYLPDGLSENVIAFPRKGSQVRYYRYLPQVQAQKDFLIIANTWLNRLPDTLVTYEMTLLKQSKDLKLNEFDYAYYTRVTDHSQSKQANHITGPPLK